MNSRTNRIVKKDTQYYPQYLNTWWFGKYKKWESFTYTMSYAICSGFAEDVKLDHKFDTRQEARNFLRRKGYRL